MTKVPTREATKQETRDALIAAGALEFAEKGLDVPSLDAICARAGFTRGAFYVHFRDRDDLLIAVVERMLEANLDQFIAGDGAPDDLEQTIGRYVAAVAAGAPSVRGVGQWRYHHTLAACARLPPLRQRYSAMQHQAMERVALAARAGQRAGTVRRDVSADALGEILVVLTLGLGVMINLEIPFDLAGGAAALARLLRAKPARRARRPGAARRRSSGNRSSSRSSVPRGRS